GTLAATITPAPSAAADTIWSTRILAGPAGTSTAALSATSCTSSTSCLAIGTTNVSGPVGAGTNHTGWVDILSGSRWTPSSLPDPPGTDLTSLNGVSCTSPTSCVVVGEYSSDASVTNGPLAETLAGTTWTAAALPEPTGAIAPSLVDVSCPSA